MRKEKKGKRKKESKNEEVNGQRRRKGERGYPDPTWGK